MESDEVDLRKQFVLLLTAVLRQQNDNLEAVRIPYLSDQRGPETARLLI